MKASVVQSKAPTPAQVAREISSRLRRIGDPVRTRGAQQYFKHEIVALGIATPALRAFVRTRARALRQEWRAPQAIELCDRLLREAGKSDMPRLKNFLLRHGPAIPRTALRYAIERFPAAQKADLLQGTRVSGPGRQTRPKYPRILA